MSSNLEKMNEKGTVLPFFLGGGWLMGWSKIKRTHCYMEEFGPSQGSWSFIPLFMSLLFSVYTSHVFWGDFQVSSTVVDSACFSLRFEDEDLEHLTSLKDFNVGWLFLNR